MLVKSIAVPLVDATAVPLVKTPTPVGVPAKVGLVKVPLLAEGVVKVGVVKEALVRLGLSPDIVIAIIKPLGWVLLEFQQGFQLLQQLVRQ
jgi:hypothetical protein